MLKNHLMISNNNHNKFLLQKVKMKINNFKNQNPLKKKF